VLCNKRTRCKGKPCTKTSSPLTVTREKPACSHEDPAQPRLMNKYIKLLFKKLMEEHIEELSILLYVNYTSIN